MMEDDKNSVVFIFEVPPEGTLDELRELVTEGFKSEFGDIDCRITMQKVKEEGGTRTYRGIVEEII